MNDEMRIILGWCGFMCVMFLFKAPFVIWAIRTGQFRRNDDARSLPLRARVPEATEEWERVIRGRGKD